jgi:NADH-quinone oxidoreductase subunit M
VSLVITVLAATGLVLSAIYSLWLVQRVFTERTGRLADARPLDAQTSMMAVLIIVILWIGLHPQPF